MGRTDNAKRNLIWGFIQKIVSVLIPFVSRTIMIYVLGMEYIGLNSLFASILSMLSFAELGIGSALVFSMYKPIADGDDDKVCALLAFYRRCYIVIGTIIVGCGLVILPFLDKFITGDVPSDTNIYVLFLIYLFNSAVGYFLFAYKQSILIASQRIDLVSKVNLIVSFFLNVLQIAALLIFRSYYAFIIILPVSTCVSNLWIAYVTKEHYPQYICKGMIGKEEIKVIAEKVGGLLCQKIGNIVLCNVDAIVISSFLGLRILGIYNGYFYVISTLMGFLYIIQQTLIPSVGNSIAKESKEKNYKDFSKFQYIYMWIVSWCSVCLLVLFQPFIGMWQGTEHLNVCIVPENGAHNCSCCSKCMRTLMPLEAMGKLDEFSEVFDLDVYRKNSHKNKVMIMASYKKEGFATDNVDFLISHGVQMPGKMEVFTYKTVHTMKIYGRRILGNKFYDGIKHIIQK